MDRPRLTLLSLKEAQVWEEIRGRLLASAGELLYDFASHANPDGVAVEIGSFAGKSTVCIARGLKESRNQNARLFAIDIHFQSDFKDNLADFGVSEMVECLEQASLDAAETWTQPISFLYIDAHHGKAHAYADLVVWDSMVIPGGFVALDDTGGFMLGPNLQLQAALRTSAYDLVTEAGGMSFLRKKQSLFPFLSDFPLSDGSLMAYVQYVSAWLGAMNPDFRAPRRPEMLPRPKRRRSKLNEILTSFWDMGPRRLARLCVQKSVEEDSVDASLRQRMRETGGGAKGGPREARRILEWLGTQRHGEPADQTLAYLQACFDLRLSQTSAAIAKLKTLSVLDRALQFLHYKIGVREMSILRLAQAYDLEGARGLAEKEYAKLIQEAATPEIRNQAQLGISTPFRHPEVDKELLLREYALELSEYRAFPSL
jgi:MMP 1-O-methyltransferase